MNLKMMFFSLLLSLLLVLTNAQTPNQTLKLWFSRNDIDVIVGETEYFDLYVNGTQSNDFDLNMISQHDGLIQIIPQQLKVTPSTTNYTFSLLGLSPGHLEVSGQVDKSQNVDDSNLFLRITLANSKVLIYISLAVGWLYFAAWSVSFYPQIFYNFRRKSVVGLNFDFLALNLMGHTLYGVFNIALYWIPYIEHEYFNRYPRGLNPVKLNDVFFSIHASLATAVTVGQCFIYERGDQRVSWTARGFLSVFFAIIIVTVILAIVTTIHWLDFLYFCSYIKLAITLIKYIPQAVMNYRRKSTVGWSIGNILLDFTGGTLSMLQMILNSYNYDDWASIFGDPTKFGLGLFSVLFDIFFILQHYVFYRNSSYTPLTGANDEVQQPTEASLDQPIIQDDAVIS